uniref:Uncharacterized protein n=1 Tax=Romanomermis culicivorax TaxID=13658 RepID=A0A915ITC2_ROMCU
MAALITVDHWQSYLSGEVVNSIGIENERTVEFPAITICNQIVMRRSTGCRITDMMQFFQHFSLSSRLVPWTDALARKNVKYCPCKDDKSGDSYLFAAKSTLHRSLLEMFSKYGPPWQDTYLLCQMGGVTTNCSKIFFNHITDIGLCSTFNMAFFKNATEISPPTTSKAPNFGPSSGLKLVLKASRSEYCGVNRPYDGMGFFVSIHGQSDTLPLYVLSNFGKRLTPGFASNIALKATTFIRSTAHLNRCTERMIMAKGERIRLNKSICFAFCLVQTIWDTCNCMGHVVDNLEDIFSIENGFSHINHSKPCSNSREVACEMCVIRRFKQDDVWVKQCPPCLPSCQETVYEAMMTAEKLNTVPSAGLRGLAEKSDMIVSSFYLQSSQVTRIHEDQAFTLTDAIIYTANSLGLFFGISFTTIFEILFEILLYLHSVIVKRFLNYGS